MCIFAKTSDSEPKQSCILNPEASPPSHHSFPHHTLPSFPLPTPSDP